MALGPAGLLLVCDHVDADEAPDRPTIWVYEADLGVASTHDGGGVGRTAIDCVYHDGRVSALLADAAGPGSHTLLRLMLDGTTLAPEWQITHPDPILATDLAVEPATGDVFTAGSDPDGDIWIRRAEAIACDGEGLWTLGHAGDGGGEDHAPRAVLAPDGDVIAASWVTTAGRGLDVWGQDRPLITRR